MALDAGALALDAGVEMAGGAVSDVLELLPQPVRTMTTTLVSATPRTACIRNDMDAKPLRLSTALEI